MQDGFARHSFACNFKDIIPVPACLSRALMPFDMSLHAGCAALAANQLTQQVLCEDYCHSKVWSRLDKKLVSKIAKVSCEIR